MLFPLLFVLTGDTLQATRMQTPMCSQRVFESHLRLFNGQVACADPGVAHDDVLHCAALDSVYVHTYKDPIHGPATVRLPNGILNALHAYAIKICPKTCSMFGVLRRGMH